MKPNYKKFSPGQKVKTIYGELRTVLRQRGPQVFVEEELAGWYHPSKLWKVYRTHDRQGREIWVTIPED